MDTYLKSFVWLVLLGLGGGVLGGFVIFVGFFLFFPLVSCDLLFPLKPRFFSNVCCYKSALAGTGPVVMLDAVQAVLPQQVAFASEQKGDNNPSWI